MNNQQGVYTGPKEDSFKSETEINYEALERDPIIVKGVDGKEPTFNEWIDELARRRDTRLSVEGVPTEGEIEIPSDTPIVIALMGDQHISGLYHNYELLRDHCNFIRSCPKAYVVVGGDVVDGAFFNPAQDDKIASFDEETVVATKMFEWLQDSMLCAIAGDHDCLDEETEALTDSGWKKYSELSNEDKFLTMNENMECEWNKPDNIIIEKFKGELIGIKSRHLDMLVTDKHRIAFKRRSGGSIEALPAKDFIDTSFDTNQITLAGVNKQAEYDIEDCWLQLMAWIITDGYLSETKCGITQREEKAHLPRKVLQDCGVGFSEHTRQRVRDEISGRKVNSIKPSVDFYINAEGRRKVLALLGNNKYELPHWVWKLSKRQFDVFLGSLIDGDGTRKNGKIVAFYQKNRILMDQLQGLLAFNGYRTSIYEYRDSQLRLNIAERSLIRPVNAEITHEEYDGMIWDITVPNHIFLVRRNGKTFFTGNSWSERSGITMYHDFKNKYKKPLFRGSSTLKLKVGDIDYKLVMAHRLPGHSIYNKTHPQNRESKFGQQGADIYVGWHNHQKGVSQQVAKQAGEEDLVQTMISPGAYKYSDSYSQKLGFAQQSERELGAVWIILHPDRKEVEVFWNMESAKERIDPYVKGNFKKPVRIDPKDIIKEITQNS